MKTVEEVEAFLGVHSKAIKQRWDSDCCSYNPNPEDDPAEDCGLPALWHLKARGLTPDKPYMFLACDGHLGRLLGGPYKDTIEDRHEVGSACGLRTTWWVSPENDTGSFCVTEERGVELGYLIYD